MPIDHDCIPPDLVAEAEAQKKVMQSTISFSHLCKGCILPQEIERAFSAHGCGCAIVRLDGHEAALYHQFYRLQWQLGTRVFENDPEHQAMIVAKFRAMDRPVRQLLLQCGVGVARARKGVPFPELLPRSDLDTFSLSSPLNEAVGRPLAANRREFHPSVSWLLEQEQKGTIKQDENPSYAVVADYTARGGRLLWGAFQQMKPCFYPSIVNGNRPALLKSVATEINLTGMFTMERFAATLTLIAAVQ